MVLPTAELSIAVMHFLFLMTLFVVPMCDQTENPRWYVVFREPRLFGPAVGEGDNVRGPDR